MQTTFVGFPSLSNSVQAEIFIFSDPTFLEGFDLKFHMPGHFPPGMSFSLTTRAILPFCTKIGQNYNNSVPRPPIKILRPLFTLQLLILPTRNPFHGPKS